MGVPGPARGLCPLRGIHERPRARGQAPPTPACACAWGSFCGGGSRSVRARREAVGWVPQLIPVEGCVASVSSFGLGG